MPRVIRQTTVTRDGFHNAFTDLQFWQGTYWVSYRKGSAHAAADGQAVLAISTDRERFQEVVKLKTPNGGDNRDPKLFPVSPERMTMTLSSWEGGYHAEHLQSYITFSNNGHNWEIPRPVLSKGQFLWRIRAHKGNYYGLVYEGEETHDDKKRKSKNQK